MDVWCLSCDTGLSIRPAVRGIQRQTFSSRSSIASPLVLSENGTKPSWTHSAKLQLRSNSPSRFSLESHSSSPTLEMIGEVADTKLSACAYSGSPKSERLSGVRSALVALEGNPGTRRLIEHVHSKAVVPQSEQRGGTQLGVNNNVTAGGEQVSPRHGAASVAAKEQKQRNGVVDSPGVKRTAAKTGLQNERSPKKRAATSSTSSSSLSPASPAVDKLPSRTQAKSAAALTSSAKDNSDGAARASKVASSRTATPSKKGSPQTVEASHQKRSSSPGLQSSHPQRKTSPRGGGAGEKSSVSGRTRVADKSAGRESLQTAAIAERKASTGGPASRSGPTGRSEGRAVRGADSKAVGRSSSSSSSITSLRSSAPPAGGGPPSRAAQRSSSKTEEKGLSFFKTALRPKDARKSSEGVKAEAKGVPEDSCGEKDGSQQAGKKAQNASSEGKSNGMAAKDKESAKASSAAKHSLLPSAKSKLSAAESTNQSSGHSKEPSKKEPAKKTMQSRKIPINPAQTSHKAK